MTACLAHCPEDVQIVIRTVAEDCKTLPSAIVGERRDRIAFGARRKVARTLYDAGYSSGRIGKFLNRDHTSVLNMLGLLGARSRGKPVESDHRRQLNTPWQRAGIPEHRLADYLILKSKKFRADEARRIILEDEAAKQRRVAA